MELLEAREGAEYIVLFTRVLRKLVVYENLSCSFTVNDNAALHALLVELRIHGGQYHTLHTGRQYRLQLKNWLWGPQSIPRDFITCSDSR